MKYHCVSCKREVEEPQDGIVPVGINPRSNRPTFIKYTHCVCGVVAYLHPDHRIGRYIPKTGELHMKDKFTP